MGMDLLFNIKFLVCNFPPALLNFFVLLGCIAPSPSSHCADVLRVHSVRCIDPCTYSSHLLPCRGKFAESTVAVEDEDFDDLPLGRKVRSG